jgi:hypothetical protein
MIMIIKSRCKIELGNNTKNVGLGLGNLVSLKPVNTSPTNTNTKNKVPKPTRTIKISEPLFRRLVSHSKKFYNVESFDTIIENLINSYELSHKDEYWVSQSS